MPPRYGNRTRNGSIGSIVSVRHVAKAIQEVGTLRRYDGAALPAGQKANARLSPRLPCFCLQRSMNAASRSGTCTSCQVNDRLKVIVVATTKEPSLSLWRWRTRQFCGAGFSPRKNSPKRWEEVIVCKCMFVPWLCLIMPPVDDGRVVGVAFPRYHLLFSSPSFLSR